jgi:DNA polymerase III sliding clamp (beta) subunit (PCNA family)
MKVTVKRTALLEGLAKVRSGIPNKSNLPICCRVLLRADKGLALVGTDLTSVIIVPVKAKVDKPGVHAVSPAKLEGFLKACDVENAVLEFKTTTEHYKEWEDEKDANGLAVKDDHGYNKRVQVDKKRKVTRLILEAGNASTILDTAPAKDFPPYNAVEEKPTCTFQNLSASIDEVSYAMLRDDSRPVLNGVCFRMKGKKLQLNASDGNRIATTMPLAKGQLPEFVLPMEAVNLVRKTFSGKVIVATRVKTTTDDQGQVKVVDTWVSFKGDGITVLSHAFAGTFPQVDRLIPTKGKIFQCAGDDVRKALKIIGAIKPDSNNIAFVKKGANVIASGLDGDGARTEVKFPGHGQIKVCMDIHFLADIMVRTNGTFKMRYKNDKSACVVQEGRTSHVFMPKSIQW